MRFNRKIYVLVVLVVLILLATFLLPVSEGALRVYDSLIYYPFQALRDVLFGFIPFSMGDIFYVLAGGYLVWLFVKWIRFLIRFRTKKLELAASLFNTFNGILGAYLFFILGWGANYSKQPLPKEWGLDGAKDTIRLSVYDSVLVSELNRLAPAYKPYTIAEVNHRSQSLYRNLTDTKLRRFGLNVKTSMFTWFLDRMSTEGYYNPFTGEGQVSATLPDFMLPFVICHEMAHQAGIAAEGDANLMAYAITTASGDASFKYSAMFNIWQYVDRRLYRKDSARAKSFQDQLNPLTKRHIAIMDSLSNMADNEFNAISMDMYDDYLKMQQQKEGIRSYGNIIKSAWLLEKKRSQAPISIIHIP